MIHHVCEQKPNICNDSIGNVLSHIAKKDQPFLNFHIRPVCDKDKHFICSWVLSREALKKVSGDDGNKLTLGILESWLEKAEDTIVVARQPWDTPVGFCTLSRLEVDYLPENHIEICHLIVAPEFRNLFIGSRIASAAKIAALTNGYRIICGRIVPNNLYMLALARFHHFQEISEPELWIIPGFRWFQFDLGKKQLFRCVSPVKKDGRNINEY